MLKEIRQHYGIDQSVFADYLCISRSTLSMAESGRRNIKPQLKLSLLPLYTAIAQPSKEGNETLAKEFGEQSQQLQKFLRRLKKQHEYNLPLLEEKLVAMKENQARSIQILRNIKSLMNGASPNDINLLNIIELDARKLQRKTGGIAQLKLELKIPHLQAELAHLEKFGAMS